jgi:hypothetical protein
MSLKLIYDFFCFDGEKLYIYERDCGNISNYMRIMKYLPRNSYIKIDPFNFQILLCWKDENDIISKIIYSYYYEREKEYTNLLKADKIIYNIDYKKIPIRFNLEYIKIYFWKYWILRHFFPKDIVNLIILFY